MSLVRAAGIRGFPSLVRELGGEPEGLLAAVGLDADTISDPDTYISYEAVLDLLERAAKSLERFDLGLLLAQRQDLDILGPLAVAVQHCPTVGKAIEVASRYMYIHGPALSFSLAELSDNQVAFVFDIQLDRRGPATQATEQSVGLAAQALFALSNGRLALDGVTFPHLRRAPQAIYTEHFRAPVRFGAERAALTFPRADLRLPIVTGDEQLHRWARDYLELRYLVPRHRASGGLRGEVRRLTRRMLGTGQCTADDISTALGLHPRTLQRYLRDEGTSLGEIRDEVRAEVALNLLRQSDLPISRIASLLDYEHQSTFTRSCRRWFGSTPRALRAELVEN